MTMRSHPLGKTGLFVSELCLGAMTFGGKGFWEAIGKLGGGEVESLVGTALDASVIIGAKTREQLVDNLAAVDVRIAPEHLALLDEASALPAEYPGWMIEWQNRDPRGVAGGRLVIDRAREQLASK